MKKILTIALCGLIVFSGCSSMKNSSKGGLIGGGTGAGIDIRHSDASVSSLFLPQMGQ